MTRWPSPRRPRSATDSPSGYIVPTLPRPGRASAGAAVRTVCLHNPIDLTTLKVRARSKRGKGSPGVRGDNGCACASAADPNRNSRSLYPILPDRPEKIKDVGQQIARRGPDAEPVRLAVEQDQPVGDPGRFEGRGEPLGLVGGDEPVGRAVDQE